MLKFLEDSQQFLKIFGHCAYDPSTTQNSSWYRWSRATNNFLTFLFIFFIGSSSIFVCDKRQPYDERVRSTIQLVGYLEQFVIHLTFSTQKSKVFDFLNHFEMIANQSEYAKF